MSDKISNRDELREHIHSIHNYLRNSGAGYGFDALNMFNVVYGLKIIEPLIVNGTIKMSDENKKKCLFSNMVKLAKKGEDEKLCSRILNEVLDELHKNEDTKDLIFYEISKDIKAEVFHYLVEGIDKIDTENNFHLAGKVYEYFIGRDEKAIAELGAYFTDRWITNFIMTKLKIKLDDDEVPSFCDPYGGSGGFTLAYISQLLQCAKDKKIKIDWDEEIDKIHHFDLSPHVVKMVKLELFTLTHSFPNKNNVKKTNSFTDEFENKKFKYVLSNPPYGGDKGGEKVTVLKCSKRIQNYAWKGIEDEKKNITKAGVCKNMELSGDNKENTSTLLLLSMLEKKGTLCVVHKEGVFFDSKYKKLRKEMIDNYNVKYIVDVPQDAFENTTTKTSILILEKSGKTKEICFSKLVVDKDKKGNIIGVHDEEVIKVKYDDLVKKIIQ